MDRLRVGFIGRSSTWSTLKQLVFPEHVLLRYVSDESECRGLNLVLTEKYMADLVHCPGVYVIDDVSIDGLIEAVVRGLKLSDLNIGIDIGNSRCGITILIDNTPIIHTTLGLARAVRLLRRLSRYLRINLMVGTSPGISELVRDFLDLLSGTDIRISMVDEELSNNRKRMLGSKYPYLTTDELDSLTHAYTGLSRF
ncbi:MAG: hypothetical protein L7G98_03175 [Vulcanisaeta sp.]|nr:hypothetical protein [Vulcanisaeta sp.]